MRRNATRHEKVAWSDKFRRNLAGFVPGVMREADMVHWMAITYFGQGGRHLVRLCDAMGSSFFETAVQADVDCMACLVAEARNAKES